MRHVDRGLLAGVALLLPGSAALGRPFTCEAYRDRLNGGLMVTAEKAPEVPTFRPRARGGDGGQRYGWTTSDLSGTLTCGPDDRFEEFYVTLNFVSKDKFAEQLKNLVALNGAVICAVAAETPAVCADASKAMLQDGLQQLGDGFKRRVANPSGTSDRLLGPDLKAELTAAPTLVTFSIAAASGVTIDDERRRLTPAGVKAAQ